MAEEIKKKWLWIVIGCIIAWAISGIATSFLVVFMFFGNNSALQETLMGMFKYSYYVFGGLGLILTIFAKNKWKYIGIGMLIFLGIRIFLLYLSGFLLWAAFSNA